jgi:hypothetical protein
VHVTTTRGRYLPGTLALVVGLLIASAGSPGRPPFQTALVAAQTTAPARGHGEEAASMRLVGVDDLQARSAYQPIIHRQRDRFIAYVGHHGGQALNPVTGAVEANGTSVVDVTDPARPRYLAHIPGQPGAGEAGGAQMVRACDGDTLPKGVKGATYLLRTYGTDGHQIWNVTDPARPTLVTTVLSGLKDTHKNWWECDTGIAYLVSDGRPEGWRTSRMTKIYDLADPARPVFIRNFGLAGQEPGSTGPTPVGLHGPIRVGNRVYFGYGTNSGGVLQIVDREKLLTGPREPTAANLALPQVGRLDMFPGAGAHTVFPVLGVAVPEFARDRDGAVRDFVVITDEALANECQEHRQLVYMVDVTAEARPFSVANFQVPEGSGGFCARGGRFGAHSSNESFAPVYYRRVMFFAWFNAGVRAVDIRDPFRPREIAHYIPATTARTDERCLTVGGAPRCKVAIQTNNVEVDDRGFAYIVDRANTGMHILELTGEARSVANLP